MDKAINFGLFFLCFALGAGASTPTPKKNQRQTSSIKESYKGRVVQTPPTQVLPVEPAPKAEPAPKVGVASQSGKSSDKHLLDFRPFLFEGSAWAGKGRRLIQQEITQIIQSEKQALLEDAKKLFKKTPHSNLLPYRLYVEEVKVFSPTNKDIVSVRLKFYTYTGGAHGGSQYYSWNYSQTKQKFLSLNDIFPVSDYCAKLVAVGVKPLFQKQPISECHNEAPSRGGIQDYRLYKTANHIKIAGSPVKGSKEFLNLILSIRDLLFEHEKQGGQHDKYIKRDIILGTAQGKHFKIWNLNQDDIVFIFPEYQVGPYAAGSFEVFVPLPF